VSMPSPLQTQDRCGHDGEPSIAIRPETGSERSRHSVTVLAFPL
jgi:hypothetical protein